jgi:hypothetical protein
MLGRSVWHILQEKWRPLLVTSVRYSARMKLWPGPEGLGEVGQRLLNFIGVNANERKRNRSSGKNL